MIPIGLPGFGVPNALANPTLELRHTNEALLVANDDWQDNPTQAAELTAAGLAPANHWSLALLRLCHRACTRRCSPE